MGSSSSDYRRPYRNQIPEEVPGTWRAQHWQVTPTRDATGRFKKVAAVADYPGVSPIRSRPRGGAFHQRSFPRSATHQCVWESERMTRNPTAVATAADC